jgi:hypothetical protein
LISAGSERTIVEFSKANLISKARQQPEKVKQVLDKIGADVAAGAENEIEAVGIIGGGLAHQPAMLC